ncbi:MAG: hypothetical protein JSV30_06635 [Candidatus Omnitrophota bacterium]|nr:MAG: hypothetical protein JSV30_06635 [Candidatus Omnitrophota bacterium]
MEKHKDFWNLILVGKWNKYILSPQWAAKNIFEEPELQVEFPLNLDFPLRYTSLEKNIRLLPAEDKVIFVPLKLDDECLSEVGKLTNKLFEMLPHTPMRAFGINFGFSEKDNTELYKVFNVIDNAKLGEFNCELKQTCIIRRTVYDENNLNLRLTLKGNEVLFDFNFHYDVKNAVEAKEKLKDNIVKNKNAAEKLLQEVYGLSYDDIEQKKRGVV